MRRRATDPDQLQQYVCRIHGEVEPKTSRTSKGYIHRRCPTCLKERFDKTEWQRQYRAGVRKQKERVYRRVTVDDAYTCPKCGAHEVSYTYREDGKVNRYCLPCRRAKERGEGRKHYNRIKAEVLAAYGGKCQCCGEPNPIFLTIDHMENDGAKHRKESKTSIYWKVKAEGFPSRFALACFNCNLGRAKNGGICPHQAQVT